MNICGVVSGQERDNTKTRRYSVSIGALGLSASIYFGTFLLWAQPPATRYQVYYIDVGQADAILIMDEAKTCKILIDSGDTRYPGSSKNFRTYLTQHLPTASTIDLVIATHPHNDHIGSMKWVLETYQVKKYLDNGQPYTSQLYKNLMMVVKQQSRKQLTYVTYAEASAEAEDVCGAGGPKLRVLYPKAGLDPDLCEANPNNCSVIAKLIIGNTSFLFPGDAEEDEEALLLADEQIKPQLSADVFKVGHHGSDTSSTEEFMNAVDPSWMVISAGAKGVGTNKGYKHPRVSTVRDLLTFAGKKRDVRVIDAYDAGQRDWIKLKIWVPLYITTNDGTVVLSTDGTTINKE